MVHQTGKIEETLRTPDIIVQSKTDRSVELFYRHYQRTPVTEKYLCIVIKMIEDYPFIITAYFTDSVKRGKVLWKKNKNMV